jgi:hypothetical protein
MRLTDAQRKLLERLRDAEDALGGGADAADAHDAGYDEDEVVCEGIVCYIGTDRVSPSTVKSLMRIMALSCDIEAASRGPRFYRYTLNETGRNILKDESQIDVLVQSLYEGGSWTWDENGKLKRL